MSDIIRIRCTGCDVKIKAPLKYQGREVDCPKCGERIAIPVLRSGTSAGSRRATTTATTNAGTTGRSAGNPQNRAGTVPAAVADDDLANIDFAEFQDFGPIQDLAAAPHPKPKKKPLDDDTPKPVRKKKRPKASQATSGGGFYIDPSVFGGLAVMLFGGGIFIWLWNRGIIWPWAGLICIAGAIGIVKGLLGLDDD